MAFGKLWINRLVGQLRQADWLVRERIIAWGIVLFYTELLLLLFLALWQRGVFVEVTSTTASDFVSFYAAGKLVAGGCPAARL